MARGVWGVAGYVVRDGVTIPVSHIRHHADYHPDMTQRRLEADLTDITGQCTHLVLDVYGVIKLPTRDPMSTVIYEAACTAAATRTTRTRPWCGRSWRPRTAPRGCPPADPGRPG
jgi:hypothetical protein